MFDSHAHYDDNRFDNDREQLLDALEADEAISGVLNAAVDLESSKQCLEISKRYNKFYAAVGYHPHEAEHAKDGYLEQLKAFVENDKKVVAIGEIGLDFHYDFSPRDIQRRVFAEQLDIAQSLNMPVIIHDREAHMECVDAVKSRKLRGVFHSYSGSVETAKILLDLGWYLSFNGIVTFANAAKPRAVVATIPDDRLLIETDCPYLSPVPYRGQRNDSRRLNEIIAEIAQLRGQSPEYVEKITTENAKRLFGIG